MGRGLGESHGNYLCSPTYSTGSCASDNRGLGTTPAFNERVSICAANAEAVHTEACHHSMRPSARRGQAAGEGVAVAGPCGEEYEGRLETNGNQGTPSAIEAGNFKFEPVDLQRARRRGETSESRREGKGGRRRSSVGL